MSKLVWALILAGPLGMNAGLAQDATKVEPKHYKVAFENERVQVVYIHYGPHEKSAMHDHPQGVVVNITDGHLKFTDQHGNVQNVLSSRGEARWFPPFKHTVENVGDTAYDGVYIGIKNRGASTVVSRAIVADTFPQDEDEEVEIARILQSLAPESAPQSPPIR